jgi:hypothetical protein
LEGVDGFIEEADGERWPRFAQWTSLDLAMAPDQFTLDSRR